MKRFRSPGKILMGATMAAAIAAGMFVVRSPGTGSSGVSLTNPWAMHVIAPGANGAGALDGADGAQAADVDGDGLLDLVVGFEQGLRVAVCFNPGTAGAIHEANWPCVVLPATGGNLCSAEDAVFGDLDMDGALDVVAACETGAVRVSAIFAPAPPNSRNELLNAANWTRVDIASSASNGRAMRAQIIDIAGDAQPEIVVGGKESDGPATAGHVGYYSSVTPRNAASYTFTSIVAAGWVMQMYVLDFDGDTDLDIVYSDRDPINTPSADNSKRGLRWLQSNGADPPVFTERTISPVEAAHKWFDLMDWDEDGDLDVADVRSDPGFSPVTSSRIYINGGSGLSWSSINVEQPLDIGQGQHATFQDVDDDGLTDLAFSYAQSQNLDALVWLKRSGPALTPTWSKGSIAGVLSTTSDVKLDNLLWIDIDGDGDNDAVTTEQHVPNTTGPGIGIIWFENPRAEPIIAEAQPTCSVLTAAGSTTDGTSFAAASVTPTAGRVVYSAVIGANASGLNTVTPSGLGATWVSEASVVYSGSNARRLVVHRATGALTNGVVTYGFGANTQTSAVWVIWECSRPGATPTAQVATASSAAASVTTLHAQFAGALDSPGSLAIAISGTAANLPQSQDNEYFELADVSIGNGSSGLQLSFARGETAVDPTYASTTSGLVLLEFRVQ